MVFGDLGWSTDLAKNLYAHSTYQAILNGTKIIFIAPSNSISYCQLKKHYNNYFMI